VIQYFDIGPIKIMIIIDTVVGDDKRRTIFLLSSECSCILVFSWRFVWPT